MKEDRYVIETIDNFYSDLRGITTDEFYKEYCEVCKAHGVEPRAKTIVIRLAKAETGCEVYTKTVVTKFFESREYDGY